MTSTEAVTDRRIMITGPNRKLTAPSSFTAGKGSTDKEVWSFILSCDLHDESDVTRL